MPPSSPSAPQQRLLHCRREQRTRFSIWRSKIKRHSATFLLCPLPLFLNPLHHPPTTYPFLLRSVPSVTAALCSPAVQHRHMCSICTGLAGGRALAVLLDLAGTCHHRPLSSCSRPASEKGQGETCSFFVSVHIHVATNIQAQPRVRPPVQAPQCILSGGASSARSPALS